MTTAKNVPGLNLQTPTLLVYLIESFWVKILAERRNRVLDTKELEPLELPIDEALSKVSVSSKEGLKTFQSFYFCKNAIQRLWPY
ncbi:MAG: hypothetical protein Ct9H90mP27_5160 [Gammaproteobacteria bacterium]|nr:MAG: hypothetical protein Ct9H90mP27_5160 [Gammaproteobacteria bacterium]